MTDESGQEVDIRSALGVPGAAAEADADAVAAGDDAEVLAETDPDAGLEGGAAEGIDSDDAEA